MVDDNFQFPGTTVDSIASFEISVHNVVGAAQTVYFSALDVPFSLEDNTPIEIPANDSATVVLQFAPQSLGSFSGSLEAIGSVFGSATLNFSGTGIQVVLDWTPEALVFETTAIGQTATQDVTFTNTGNGLAVIEGIDDPNGLFSVEFVDTYVAPTSPICLEYNESVYHNFYLTVDLGVEYPSTFWYIYDNNGYNSYGGDYNSPADSLELCLPVSESSNNAGFYVQFQNDQYADASMQLEDAFGNVVLELSLYDENYNYSDYSETFYITNGNPPAAPAFTPGVIEEGDSQTARVTFSPTDAGLVNGSIQFNTNSALSPTVEIACEGTGISEVSGEVCDSHWTLANSPFTLVGDVVVPVGCTLEIDPGVEVTQNGSALIILGDLVAMGTEGQPISITGGGLQWGEGDVNQLSYVNRISEDALIEEIYFNSFETDERSYEFDCYDYGTENYYTGTNQNGAYGCEDFYRYGSCQSPISEDGYSLEYRSRDYDGYLYLADSLVGNEAGNYEVSLLTRCIDLKADVTFQLQVNTGQGWIVKDEVLPETYGNTMLRASFYVNENDPIDFRLFYSNPTGDGSTSSIFIDDVRVGR